MNKYNNQRIIEKIEHITQTNLNAWKKSRGYAPDDVADKIDLIMIDWIISLTKCLDKWNENIDNLTVGELILARANLGTLVENWLKFFLIIHLRDYKKDPIRIKKNGNALKPEKLLFSQLIAYYKDNILNSSSDNRLNNWIESIKYKRNAIHAFNYRDIGTNQDLQDDFSSYLEFIEYLIGRMPDNPDEFFRD